MHLDVIQWMNIQTNDDFSSANTLKIEHKDKSMKNDTVLIIMMNALDQMMIVLYNYKKANTRTSHRLYGINACFVIMLLYHRGEIDFNRWIECI